jgi:ferredoxin-NADP reductase
MKLADFKGIFKKNYLSFIDMVNPFDDYYEFNFSIPNNLTWQPGEHGIFSMPNKKVAGKKWRVFSIASIPDEGVLKIATRISDSPSSFKENLRNLKEGDTIALRGPLGWFKLRKTLEPIILITGGIGITPIRALMKQLSTEGNQRQVILLYASEKYHLFQNELDNIADSDKKISIRYLTTREETEAAVNELSSHYGNDALYYISGAPQMIRSTKKLIKSNNVKGRRIINDPFIGY